ncbi:hypothetical protein CJU89_1007 [Yarrowia sp. B02]|nr:hypothetical protein CJU89_1007 [Yarrowia sp. B02]
MSEENLPMFPPSEEIGLTFRDDHKQPLYFFILPPQGEIQEKEYADLKLMVEKGGGQLARYPSNKSHKHYNICYTAHTEIGRDYISARTWHTGDMIRRSLDCQSLDEDILEQEMITAPNFWQRPSESDSEDEQLSETEPELLWEPADLFFSMELIRPVMSMTKKGYDSMSSAAMPQSRPATVHRTDDVEETPLPPVKQEEPEVILEPTSFQPWETLVPTGSSEGLLRPSNKALQIYIQNRNKWLELLKKLPSHDLMFLQRVTDLLSGDVEEVVKQVTYYGDDIEMIKRQPGRWDSRHDAFLGKKTGAKELAQYSVEQKLARKKYLEEKQIATKVANWLDNFKPTKFSHPIYSSR